MCLPHPHNLITRLPSSTTPPPLLNQPLLHLNSHPSPQPPNDLPPHIDPPLPPTVHHIPPRRGATNLHQQPQARQRRNRHPNIRILLPPGLRPRPPLPPHSRKDGQHPLQHKGVRAQQLARDLAVLGPPSAAAADADGEPASPAPAAVVVRREEGEVVPCCIVRG